MEGKVFLFVEFLGILYYFFCNMLFLFFNVIRDLIIVWLQLVLVCVIVVFVDFVLIYMCCIGIIVIGSELIGSIWIMVFGDFFLK